jgi:hypothetical protein
MPIEALLRAMEGQLKKVLKYRGIPAFNETILYVNKVFGFWKKYMREIMDGQLHSRPSRQLKECKSAPSPQYHPAF